MCVCGGWCGRIMADNTYNYRTFCKRADLAFINLASQACLLQQ